MKNCDIPDCPFPAFRTDKLTKKRYCNNHWYRNSTDLDKRSSLQKHMDRQKEKNSKSAEKTKVRSLINTDTNKKLNNDSIIRSQLIALADKLFGNFIKERDADKDGNIVCPCCDKSFSLEAKTDTGERIVNAMHFIKRTVYSLRFDERNVWAGCCYCNNKQHQNPKGREYKKFKDFLTLKLGVGIVWQMESQEREINRFSHSMINEVIEKYKPKN